MYSMRNCIEVSCVSYITRQGPVQSDTNCSFLFVMIINFMTIGATVPVAAEEGNLAAKITLLLQVNIY